MTLRFIGAVGVLASVFALCLPAVAQQQQRLGLKLSGDQPIQIESDKLDVDETASKATFSGNVSVVQGTTMLKTMEMIVFYTRREEGQAAPAGQQGQGIDRLEVKGKVYVKSDQQEATGDNGTFDMKTEVLTLTGERVVLSEGPNALMGCKLTVQMKSGLALFEPCPGQRIKSILTPSSQSQ